MCTVVRRDAVVSVGDVYSRDAWPRSVRRWRVQSWCVTHRVFRWRVQHLKSHFAIRLSVFNVNNKSSDNVRKLMSQNEWQMNGILPCQHCIQPCGTATPISVIYGLPWTRSLEGHSRSTYVCPNQVADQQCVSLDLLRWKHLLRHVRSSNVRSSNVWAHTIQTSPYLIETRDPL